MFQSQSSRFVKSKKKARSKSHFEAEIVNENVYVKEGNSLNKSRNKSYVLLKSPISYAGQKVGFDMLSPRFQRSKNIFEPGPGEYYNSEINEMKPKRSKLLSKAIKFEDMKSSSKMKTPHSYVGHSSLLKKTFNKLLTPKPEE